MQAAGYTSRHYVAEDIPELPAAVVGVPRSIDYGKSLGVAAIVLPVAIAASTAAGWDVAQKTLDDALSTTGATSVRVALKAYTSTAWTKIDVTEAEPARIATLGKTTKILVCDVLLEVLARK